MKAKDLIFDDKNFNKGTDLFGEILERKKQILDKKKQLLSKNISNKNKFEIRISKKRKKYFLKNEHDKEIIADLISKLSENEELKVFSNKFDAPSIIYTLNKIKKIKNIYISTWAITDRGIQVLSDLSNKITAFLLLDKTYSYKWMFSSGAINEIKNVKLKFTENHSKIILIETENIFYSFVGSMNMSNNPRIENISISTDKEEFDFWKNNILNEFQ